MRVNLLSQPELYQLTCRLPNFSQAILNKQESGHGASLHHANFSQVDSAVIPSATGVNMAWWEWNQTGDPAHPHVIVCVHGLTRQGRDFDVLARLLSQHARVICPDVVGRGQSGWLADSAGYQVPAYALDLQTLLAQVHQRAPIHRLDWVGTSMGGLIGMLVCGSPNFQLPVPVRRLVLNDVGPSLEWSALQRIGSYLGKNMNFSSLQEAADALWQISASFGAHSAEQWLELSRHMVRATAQGYSLHYDPAIAAPFRNLKQSEMEQTELLMWQLYDQIKARTLVLRGANSDLLSRATAQQMTQRGACAQWVEFEGVGHAPTLIANHQTQVVVDFLLGS